MYGNAGVIGSIDEDLAKSVRRALKADRAAAAEEAKHYSWTGSADKFVLGLALPSEQLNPNAEWEDTEDGNHRFATSTGA
jgi:hypothetical protein